MTRQIRDRFTKDYLKELLSRLGEVETSREVAPEVPRVDVYFVPGPNPTGTDPKILGKFNHQLYDRSPCILPL